MNKELTVWMYIFVMTISTVFLGMKFVEHQGEKIAFIEEKHKMTLDYIMVKLEREEARELAKTLELELRDFRRAEKLKKVLEADETYFKLQQNLEIERTKRLIDVANAEIDLVKIQAQVDYETKVAEGMLEMAQTLDSNDSNETNLILKKAFDELEIPKGE